MILTETILCPLGSRFSLNFRPQRRDLRISALGRFLDYTAQLAIGVRLADGQERVLPLCADGEVFEYCEQELTANSITFRARSAKLGVRLEATFTSPFYPGDAKLSTAPFFYLDVRVAPIRDMVHWEGVPEGVARRGQLFLRAHRPGMSEDPESRGCSWSAELALREDNQSVDPSVADYVDETGEGTVTVTERIELLHGDPEEGAPFAVVPFDLERDEPSVSFVWAAHVADPVLEDLGEPTRFRYTQDFGDVQEVIAYARDEEERIRRRSALFDSLLSESSLGKTQCDFIAYTLQSYLANTWWTVRRDGREWFSVWEGVCLFNSTIDVEYNLGLFYFALWPELLELTFDQWARHEKTGPLGSWLSHDMGAGVKANGQSYPHEMEVEENANFLLMLHAHWRWTGKEDAARRHQELVRRLADYLIAVDTTGNGFPNEGTANTIDDASPAIQYAREQTYLAVKVLCALDVTADLASLTSDVDLQERCKAQISKIRATLDGEAWLGDHYAVCIDRTTEGLTDVWNGSDLGPGELPGWDAYSLYASNGMLYPMLTGRTPPVDHERMRGDIEAGLREALLEYGCTHSSADRSNIWVSQNLWRDFIAAYLGLDCLGMADRYWAFLLQENTQQSGKCFIDTYVANNLCYYPRGITSVGAFFAALGFWLDRVDGRCGLKPVRVPCRFPLLALADWEREAVPWVEYRLLGGHAVGAIEGEVPEGLEIQGID